MDVGVRRNGRQARIAVRREAMAFLTDVSMRRVYFGRRSVVPDWSWQSRSRPESRDGLDVEFRYVAVIYTMGMCTGEYEERGRMESGRKVCRRTVRRGGGRVGSTRSSRDVGSSRTPKDFSPIRPKLIPLAQLSRGIHVSEPDYSAAPHPRRRVVRNGWGFGAERTRSGQSGGEPGLQSGEGEKKDTLGASPRQSAEGLTVAPARGRRNRKNRSGPGCSGAEKARTSRLGH